MCERKQDTKMSLLKNVGSEKCSDMTGLFKKMIRVCASASLSNF